MNKCIGLTGIVFGHKYHSVITDYSPPLDLPVLSEFIKTVNDISFSDDIEELIDKLTSKKYTICCLRCGQRPEE